jgi:hypothetical protein
VDDSGRRPRLPPNSFRIFSSTSVGSAGSDMFTLYHDQNGEATRQI